MGEQIRQQGSGNQVVQQPHAGPSADTVRRWRSEAEFFDLISSQLREQASPLSQEEFDRYRKLRHPWLCKEYRVRMLGDLRGARLLDLGCGGGENSILFAKLGARVTGFDISPQSVDLATHRAKINGVARQAQFLYGSAEEISFADNSFDVVRGDGVLHHLIPVLDLVLGKASRWVRPGGRALFSEPVCLSATLRRLRRHVPVHTDATPDERPLQRAEMEIIRKHIPDLRLRWFNLLGRFNRFVLAHPLCYERSSLPRRVIANALGLADWGLLSLPGLGELGGTVAMSGTFAKK